MTANQISKFLSYEATLIEDEDNRIPNFMYLTCFEKKIQCYLFELLSFYDKYVLFFVIFSYKNKKFRNLIKTL